MYVWTPERFLPVASHFAKFFWGMVKVPYHLSKNCHFLLIFEILLWQLLKDAQPSKALHAKSFIQRVQFLEAIHDSTECSLWNMRNCVVGVLKCTTLEKQRILFNIMLSLYVADIHETGSIISVETGKRLTPPCHCCMIARKNFGALRVGETRRMVARLKLPVNQISECVRAARNVTDLSMFEVSPVLNSFPFVEFLSSVDINDTFRFGTTHSLYIWLSEMLKECLFKNLSDPESTSCAIEYWWGWSKPFPDICIMVLKYLNLFLQEAKYSALEDRLNIDFLIEIVEVECLDFQQKTLQWVCWRRQTTVQLINYFFSLVKLLTPLLWTFHFCPCNWALPSICWFCEKNLKTLLIASLQGARACRKAEVYS